MKSIREVRPETGGVYTMPPTKKATPKEKPTAEFCAKQLSRLATKRGAPTYDKNDDRDDFRVKTVLAALLAGAEDAAHVVRIVDRLEQGDAFPDGYAVRNAAFDTRTQERRPDPGCNLCNGIGFRVVSDGGQGGAVKCDCWREVEVSDAKS